MGGGQQDQLLEAGPFGVLGGRRQDARPAPVLERVLGVVVTGHEDDEVTGSGLGNRSRVQNRPPLVGRGGQMHAGGEVSCRVGGALEIPAATTSPQPNSAPFETLIRSGAVAVSA